MDRASVHFNETRVVLYLTGISRQGGKRNVGTFRAESPIGESGEFGGR